MAYLVLRRAHRRRAEPWDLRCCITRLGRARPSGRGAVHAAGQSACCLRWSARWVGAAARSTWNGRASRVTCWRSRSGGCIRGVGDIRRHFCYLDLRRPAGVEKRLQWRTWGGLLFDGILGTGIACCQVFGSTSSSRLTTVVASLGSLVDPGGRRDRRDRPAQQPTGGSRPGWAFSLIFAAAAVRDAACAAGTTGRSSLTAVAQPGRAH